MPYTDQFERADPLTVNPLGLFDLWPRQAVWEARALLADGKFPKPYKIGPRTTGWRVEEVRQWMVDNGLIPPEPPVPN